MEPPLYVQSFVSVDENQSLSNWEGRVRCAKDYFRSTSQKTYKISKECRIIPVSFCLQNTAAALIVEVLQLF